MTATILNSILVLAAIFLAVFAQGAFEMFRRVTGVQFDLLPALMVYASLTTGLETLVAAALLGGLGLDALSANPLGISVLPLFVVGLAIHLKRELILRDQIFAQFTLGLAASAAVPFMTLVLLLTLGHTPLLGWGTLWQFIVITSVGGVATPALFWVFNWMLHALVHSGDLQTSFRSDREIQRGRY
jgi:rod shape-determining protein MreD